MLSQSHEISLYLSREYLLSLTLINSDPIHRIYMTTLGSHPYIKATKGFITTLIFSQGESIKHNNLVNYDYPIVNVMIHRRLYSMYNHTD